jgi:histone H3/H4
MDPSSLVHTGLPVPPGAGKRKYKKRSATVARREIRLAQKSTHRLIPAKAMDRLVREIANAVADQPLRFGGDAVKALHESAEAYLIEVMASASANAAEKNRVTVMAADLKMGVKMVS